jgi:hypothetical protein
MSTEQTKRQILQRILDTIESGWQVKKPSPTHPNDPELICIFQRPAENKEADIPINISLFKRRRIDEIRELVELAIRNARIIDKSFC